MKKNISKISGLLLLGAFALTSCHKTVTPKKLDGEWNLTSGTGTYSETNGGITTSSTIAWNGSTQTVTTPGEPIGTSPYTVSVKFDKKAGTYTKVTSETRTTTSDIDYIETNFNTGTVEQTDVNVIVSTESGTFTITGGTGDIEKNTQIVLATTSSTTISSHTYTYKEDGVSVSATGKYATSGSGSGSVLPTSLSTTSSDTGKSPNVFLMTVESLKKGVMVVKINDDHTYVSAGGETSIQNNDMSWTLTQK